MGLHTEWMRYGDRNKYTAYAARMEKAKEPLPAVIVIQEIWGVDDHIQDVTRRLAQAGYAAFAPDLFSRDGAREEGMSFADIEAAKQFLNTIPPAAWRDLEQRQAALAKLPDAEGRRIAATLDGVFSAGARAGAYVEQLLATTAFLRETHEPTRGQGVASVGFCLGGMLSARLATRDPGLRGAVIFYGNPPAVEDLPGIRCPLLGIYGELDPRITDGVPEFADALKAAGVSFEHHIYEGAPHAFFNDSRPSYHLPSARDAWVRTLGFLQNALS